MSLIHQIISLIGLGISLLGVLVVSWGIVEAIMGFLRGKLSPATRGDLAANALLRQRLGGHLLLGLEVFIAADIIGSVVSPSLERVGILGAIVAIRTVLGYFLTREVERRPRNP